MHAGSSSLTRDRTLAPCIGSAESYLLDHQGSPTWEVLNKKISPILASLYNCKGIYAHCRKIGKQKKYIFKKYIEKEIKIAHRASLVVQWLRIHLPTQGTRVWALIREDPTCHGATKPVRHNYWAWALEPVSHNYWAHMPQLLKPARLETVLRSKRGHCNEKPAHPNEE